MKNRVVITGLGMVTPVGNNVQSTWNAILNGKSGVAPVTAFDVSDMGTRIVASVKDFNVEDCLSKKEARKFDRFIQFGVAASKEAIEDSGIEVTDENSHRIGVCIGAGLGGVETIEENHLKLVNKGPRRVSPFLIPGSIINMVAGQLSIMYGMKGPNLSIVTACTTGVHNIGHAARMIAYGDADVMIAGGAEMATTKLVMQGFAVMNALSSRNDDPEAASRPWDKGRDGFVLGDGAGVVVLESLESATKRGAKIYAELSGFGMSGDGFHMTSPPENGEGGAMSMTNALKYAEVNSDNVQYINAHGTSTPAGDIAETRAVKSIFGDHAYQLKMSSTKSMTGHLLGASGSIETIFTALAVRDQVAPPTINLDDPEDECDLNYVAHTSQETVIEHAICNSFGFGGTNGSLLLSKFK